MPASEPDPDVEPPLPFAVEPEPVIVEGSHGGAGQSPVCVIPSGKCRGYPGCATTGKCQAATAPSSEARH
jgi:hypothetical protein